MRLILATVLVAALSSTTAIGQETGSIIKRGTPASLSDATRKEDQGRVLMARYATCLVDRNPTLVKRALDASFSQFNDVAKRMSVSDCLRQGQFKFPAAALRGPLFTALYRKYRTHQVPMEIAGGRPVANSWTPNIENNAELVGWYQIASCLVDGNGTAARSLVLADPATTREDAALRTLLPDLAACLPGRQQFKIPKMVLSGLVAEVLYRTEVAVMTPTGGN